MEGNQAHLKMFDLLHHLIASILIKSVKIIDVFWGKPWILIDKSYKKKIMLLEILNNLASWKDL